MKYYSTNIRVLIIVAISILLSSCIKVPQFDVMMSESQISVYENDGSVEVEFVLPDGPRNKDVEVAYRLGGTAKKGMDYTTREEDYIFIPGDQSSNSFTINLIDNTIQDGPRTIVVAIILVVYNGNSVYQGAERQSITILIEDDDCTPYIGGEWDYTAVYYMHSLGDTAMVGQDGLPLIDGASPEFNGVVTIASLEGNRNYIIDDMFIGMFSLLDINTPSPFHDNCGALSGPNDGSVLLMGTLPAILNGTLENENTIIMDFEYADDENTVGGFGQAVLTSKQQTHPAY